MFHRDRNPWSWIGSLIAWVVDRILMARAQRQAAKELERELEEEERKARLR